MITHILTHILVILAALATCYCDRVFVELADGGKSHPIKVMPMEHDHNYESKTTPQEQLPIPLPEALSADRPTEYPSENEEGESGMYPEDLMDTDKPKIQNSESTNNVILHDEVENVTQQTEKMPTLTHIVTTTQVTTTPVITTTTTTETTPVATTTIPEKVTTRHPTTTTSPEPTPFSSQPKLPCHEECLKALNESRLYTQDGLVGQGSNVTLTFELLLNSAYVLEDLIWLYQKENPVPQCSLTAQEFIHSCEGFQTISDTKEDNKTFVRETITLVNVRANYSGQYMCQVRLTCCPEFQEHVMSEERSLHVKVEVWYADYTFDLAVTGSIAAVLAVFVVVGSIYIYRKQKAQYTFIADDIHEVKPCTVLHIPLVDDEDDNESFDSNSDDEFGNNFNDQE